MNSLCRIALLVAVALTMPAAAQSPDSSISTRQQAKTVKDDLHDTGDNAAHRITVDVWSSADGSQPGELQSAKLSPRFAAAGLNAVFRMESAERRIENSLRGGFPLGEFWVANDLAAIDDAVRIAELNVANNIDSAALQELQKQSRALRSWTNWLIEQNKRLALTEYYISGSALDNDDRFQNSVACTRFLGSMFSGGRLAESTSCIELN